MTQLTPQQIKQLQDKFLGKRISVPYNGPYKRGNDDTVGGVCEYLDYNPNFPSWGLQVTISRMPIQNVDHTKIKLI